MGQQDEEMFEEPDGHTIPEAHFHSMLHVLSYKKDTIIPQI